MTGTIDEAFHLSEGVDTAAADDVEAHVAAASALLEQAKGVLIFRYSIDAATALGLIQRWSRDAGEDIGTVAHALVHDICQGDLAQPADRSFVRWLEERLRHEFPTDVDTDAG
jgi:hypothetical protein